MATTDREETLVNLQTAAAYWALDQLPGEDIPDIAAQAVSHGLESPSLLLLAGEQAAPKRNLADLFEKALREADIEIPAKNDAVRVVARYYAAQIADSSIDPYEGLTRIVRDACYSLQHTPEDLLVFVGLESEYDDFSGEAQVNFYGKDHCDVVQQEIKKKVVAESRRLLGVT